MGRFCTKSQTESKIFRFKPLWIALLASFPLLTPRLSLSAESAADKKSLPDMGVAAPQKNNANFSAGPNGARLENNFGRQKVVVTPEYSNQTGLSIGAALASMLGDNAAVGVILTAGADKKEWLINAGYQLDARQRFIVTAGQLEQFLDYSFRSGNDKVGMTQNSGALSYQLQLGNEFLRFLEVNGYVAKTDSRDLSDKTFAVDSATLFELWNDPRRIAGAKVTGLQGKLGFSPLQDSVVKVSLGQERLSYDLLTGTDSVNRLTAGLEWLQQLGSGYQLKVGADTFASQNRYTVGIDRSLAGSGGRHNLGVSLVGLRGRDGLGDDNQLKLTYSYVFGAASGRGAAMPMVPRASAAPDPTSPWSGSSLLDQVAMRPSFIPSHVVAKIDNTALPTRLIAVDKTALPAGSSVNTTTGDVTTPLGVVVTGIAGVTRNLAAFANTGQFSLSGNSLVISPSLIVQPAVGVVDSYVVTVNNFGGGTTLVTVLISHGSVKVDSIVVTAGGGADIIAPTTTVAPSVSAITPTGTTLSVTINENGTGYYLVLPTAAAAPSVAAVQAGTSFAMTANVAATPVIGGLTASTAYKIWFVAKDAANNVQAAVQNVAVTTSAPADITAPTTTVAPSVSGTTATGTTLSATINENGTGYYLVLPAAAAAPSVAAVQAGTSFAMTANVAASPAISGLTALTAYKVWFVAKDAANNVQAAVQNVAVTTTAVVDVTPPVTSSAPAISVAATDTMASVTQTINENGTGYYLVLPTASAVPSVAAVKAGTAFAMTAATPAVVALTGLTPSTAYKYYFVAKDAANNDQAAVSAGLAITTWMLDTIPDAFTFVDQTNTALSTLIESAAITVTGISTASAITVVGGEYQINGGAWVTGAGSVSSGQTVKVRHTSSGANSTLINTTLTIGGISDTFSTTTIAAADVTPPPTPATLTLTGNAGALAGFSNTQAIALAVAAATETGELWYVTESSSAPAAGAGGWSSTQPTSFTLSAGDGVKNVYVYVKDSVGNVQTTGKLAAIALDTALPTIAARAGWGAGAASGATIAGRSVTFNDTAGGTAQTVAVTASSGSIANLVPGAFGAATTFDFVAPANNSAAPINVTITYSVTDKGGNVTSTTDTVSVAAAVPATPTGLNFTGQVLSWNAVPGAVSYNVDDIEVGGSLYTGATNSFNAIIAGAGSGETLSITATNAFGITSAAATIVVPLAGAPATPTGLNITGPTMSWNAVPGATSYTVENVTTGEGVIYTGAVTSFNIFVAGALSGDTLSLTAINASGTSTAATIVVP